MIPIPDFAPPYVNALGSAIAGIAAAIAGAIAVRVMSSKQRNVAPVAQARPGSAQRGDEEPVPMERPKAPPASIRLALPPEAAGEAEAPLSETDPRLAAMEPNQEFPREGPDVSDGAATR